MSYQAVIRNSNGALVVNTAVGMQISILQGSSNGSAVYVETQTPTTNANGLVSFGIGSGDPTSFATIDWSQGSYFIKTETDPTGGINYTINGTSQLMSVPFALYAETGKTQTVGNNSTKLATTSFVQNQLLNTSELPTSVVQGAIWTTPTTGTLNGIAFTLTNSISNTLTDWDLRDSDFSVAPLSETQTLTDYPSDSNWTITFASPISNLKLYCKYWRTGDYTFDNSFSILSGSGLSKIGKTLTVNGTWGNGIVEFVEPITALNLINTTYLGGSYQVMTFGYGDFSPIVGGTGIVTRVDSPIFKGTPTAPTALAGTNTDQLATTAFVTAATQNFVNLTSDQTIAGAKKFSSDVTINGTNFGSNGKLGNVGIGVKAGSKNQGTQSIAIGNETGTTNQGSTAVAIGTEAGINTQGSNAVSIGAYAASVTQGSNAVAVGYTVAYTNQGPNAVAIGYYAASTNQGPNAIAIGSGTGYDAQGEYAVAVGASAGNTNQGSYAIAMGINSGNKY
jgi:hypothetical protein